MNILGIDTSTGFAGVGLSVDGKLSSETWWSRHNHGREVMPAVMRLLESAGITAADLDAVAVATGPGGFSAVRVGIATGQGLTAPTDARLLGVPTHLVQSFQHRHEVGMRIVSLIPIGRNQLSYAVYAGPISGCDEHIDTGLCDESEVADRFGDAETMVCGEGSLNASEAVRDPQHQLAIASERIVKGYELDEDVMPIYSRPPTITASSKVSLIFVI